MLPRLRWRAAPNAYEKKHKWLSNHELRESGSDDILAHVCPDGNRWSVGGERGWYWHGIGRGGRTYRNTLSEGLPLFETAKAAKADALAWVKSQKPIVD